MLKYEHGGNSCGADILHDFSANINPLGMPGSVKNAIINCISECEKYPDPFCRKLREKLSEKECISPEKIICGNGAADLIFRIVKAIDPGSALIAVPTFSEYEKALSENGSSIKKHFLSEENDFILDEKILDKISGVDVDMLILCTPNNPTGVTIPNDLMKEICKKCLAENVVFLCDECFMDFVKNGEKLSAGECLNSNVIVLKAFTKIYAMAGLRLGYAVFGSSQIAEKVRKTGQCWSVSVPAQAAGTAVLSENEYVRKTAALIETEREFLTNELKKIGFTVFPSEANFILFKTDIPLYEMLLKEKILIRNCDNYDGLGCGFYRAAIRTHNENEVLISAVRRVVNG